MKSLETERPAMWRRERFRQGVLAHPSEEAIQAHGPQGMRAPHDGQSGEVSERSNEHAWKACGRAQPVPRVQIPPSPPIQCKA